MATECEDFDEERSQTGSQEGFYDELLNDVYEFLQDLDVQNLTPNLQERYHTLLQDVKNVFEDNAENNQDYNDDTGYGEELVDSSTPDRYDETIDEEIDDNFIHFNNNKPSNAGFGSRYPNREKAEFENDEVYDETNLNQDIYEPVKFDRYDDSSDTYSLDYIDVIRLAQRSGPISMRFLMRTRRFIGVISIGRLILYREEKPPSHEKVFDTEIKLQGQDLKVDVNPDIKHDKRLNLTVVSFIDGKRKDETYEFKADDKIDRDEWVRSLRQACSNDIEESIGTYDELEITSADELEYDEFASSSSRKTSNVSQTVSRQFSQDDVEAVATSEVMSNLLPFEKHKNKFSSRFQDMLPKYIPEPSEDDDFFEDYDVDYSSQRPVSNKSDEMKSSDVSITFRKHHGGQTSKLQTPDESRTSQEDFFEDYYKDDRSNVASSNFSNYGTEENHLPPPPPEDELNVNFSFDHSFNGIKAFNGDRTSYTSSDCPSPLPPKHSTPTKPPPPPLPPSKSLKIKAAAPKPKEVKEDVNAIGKTKAEPPARSLQTSLSFRGSKSSSNINASSTSPKRIETNPDAKANWGNIAAMIANKPTLKSNQNRNQRLLETKLTYPEETELEKLMKRVAKRNLAPSDPASQGNNKKSELQRTESLSRTNLSVEENEAKENLDKSFSSKSTGLLKASSFKHRAPTGKTNISEIALPRERKRINIPQDDEVGSELQQKLQLRCQKISNAAASQKAKSETIEQNGCDEIPQPKCHDQKNFDSLQTFHAETNDTSINQDVDLSHEVSDEDGYMRVKEKDTIAPAAPLLPSKGQNALPLPPKKNNFAYQEEEHYAVPKNLQSNEGQEENKPKRRSLTKPLVPNKPITLRKPPLTAKPSTLKMQTNPGTNSRNRTACKAVLHTNAANKTHLKLFQPVNDAHTRIKGALRAKLRS